MKREKHNDKSSKQQILRMHPLAEPGYYPQIETSKSLCRDTNIVEIPYSPTCIRMWNEISSLWRASKISSRVHEHFADNRVRSYCRRYRCLRTVKWKNVIICVIQAHNLPIFRALKQKTLVLLCILFLVYQRTTSIKIKCRQRVGDSTEKSKLGTSLIGH